jgi:MFS family permease
MHGKLAQSETRSGVHAALTSVWMVILAAGILQTANGLQTDILGVRGGLAAFPSWSIGVMMAGYYVGFSIAPVLSPAIVRRLGHAGAVACGVAIAAMLIVLHGLFVAPLVWTVLRAICGFFLSVSYVAIESFINDRVDSTARGRVLSIYMVLQMTGMTLAQGLFLIADPRTISPFVLCGTLFLLASAPLLLVVRDSDDHAPPEPFGLVRLFKLSPLGVIATILAGTSWATLFTFGPVYAQRKGFDLTAISVFMSLAMVSGALMQFPLGWLSDLAGRRRTIALLCGGATIAAIFGAWASYQPVWVEDIAAAVIGGLVFPLYALSAAHTNDAVLPANRVAASAGLILLFGLGSIMGPLAAGVGMTTLGPVGFFAVLTLAMLAGLATAIATR